MRGCSWRYVGHTWVFYVPELATLFCVDMPTVSMLYLLTVNISVQIVITRVVSHLARSNNPTLLELRRAWPAVTPPTLL